MSNKIEGVRHAGVCGHQGHEKPWTLEWWTRVPDGIADETESWLKANMWKDAEKNATKIKIMTLWTLWKPEYMKQM